MVNWSRWQGSVLDPQMRDGIKDADAAETQEHAQRFREGAARQQQRARQKQGVSVKTGWKQPRPGSEKRVMRA